MIGPPEVPGAPEAPGLTAAVPAEPLAVADATEHEHPEREEHERRQHPGQDLPQQAAARNTAELDVVRREVARQFDIDARRHELLGAFARGAAVLAAQQRAVHLHARDPVVLERLLEGAVADLLHALRRHPEVAEPDHRQHGGDEVQGVNLRFPLHGRICALSARADARY